MQHYGSARNADTRSLPLTFNFEPRQFSAQDSTLRSGRKAGNERLVTQTPESLNFRERSQITSGRVRMRGNRSLGHEARVEPDAFFSETFDNQDIAPVRKKRRGGKIYSGCITCRERKIKCDGQRPYCHNCRKSRDYVCEGYGDSNHTALATSPPESNRIPSPSADTRHIIVDAESDPSTIISNDRICDKSPEPSQRYSYPPHPTGEGVYGTSPEPVHNEDFSLLVPDFRDSQNELFDLSLNSSSLEFFSFDPSLPDLLQAHEDEVGWRDAEDDRTEDVGPHLVERDSSEVQSSTLGLRQPTASPNPDLPWQPAHRWRNPGPDMKLSLINDPDLSHQAHVLLDFYRNRTCMVMMPTLAPSLNPWLQVLLPLALHKPRTVAKQALLNAVLSLSAFHRAGTSPSPSEYRAHGAKYRETSNRLLRSIMKSFEQYQDSFNTTTDRQALLAAALTLNTIEVFCGGVDGKGFEYLQLAKHIIQNTGDINWWLSQSANMTLLQIFRCLRIIADTSGRSTAEVVPLLEANAHSEASDERDSPVLAIPSLETYDYTLDMTYGVSMKTLHCLNKIVELANIKSQLSPSQDWPERSVQDLLQLEDDLFQSLDDPTALNTPRAHGFCPPSGVSDIVAEEIKENHLWAFHYSVALFFRRALCNDCGKITPPLRVSSTPRPSRCNLSGQELVAKAFECLENIEAITGDEIPITTTLWPGFVAAAEAVNTDLRHRALIWFARVNRHGIGNTARAKALVMEVWRRVDRQAYQRRSPASLKSELGSVDWRGVMRQMGMYIMLT